MPHFIERSFLTQGKEGFYRIVYSDYGHENDQIVICVHGLTGNGHDFGIIAPALVENGYRVIAVDMLGRGRSDFSVSEEDYAYHQYLHDLNALMAHLGINRPQSVDWIGTSMGGLLGFRLAGMKNTPIRRMIINDIGPSVPQACLDFISEYIEREYQFDSVDHIRAFMKEMRGQTYGPVTDEQWTFMAEHNARPLSNGKVSFGYDPKLAPMFAKEPIGNTADLWEFWDNMTCPALILRGADSEIFPADVADEMTRRGPGANGLVQLETLEGCGHVPSLMAPYQIEMILNWLKNTDIPQ